MSIDSLLDELETMRVRFDRRALIRHLFDAAKTFIEYYDYPRTDEMYQQIIEWKIKEATAQCAKVFRLQKNCSELEITPRKEAYTPKQLEILGQMYDSYLKHNKRVIG